MWYHYNFDESSRYNSCTAQINSHMDNLSKENKSAISENTESIKEQTAKQTEDAQLNRTNETTLFGNLIKTIKSLFSKDKDSSFTGETFYELVQRENNETQEYLDKYEKNSKSISDNTKAISDNTKAISDGTAEISENTKTISDSIKDIVSKLEAIKTQDKSNADKISNAIDSLKHINESE